MKKIFYLGLVFFLSCCLIVAGCGPGVDTGEKRESEKEVVVISDGKGNEVELACPVARIISINPGASEVICALGGLETIIGRSAPSVFPAALEEIQVVADSSNKPNMELIIESQPDLVVADSMFKDDLRERLLAAGIPCLIYVTSDVEGLPNMVAGLGEVLGKRERAQQLIDYYEGYFALIEERTAQLAEEDKPLIYYEWNKPYYSTNSSGPAHYRMSLAGGRNMAADEPVRSPTLAPEWIAEKDPDLIIRMSSRGDSPEQLEELYQEVLNRTGLSKTKAVRDERVYLMSWDISSGIRSVIGTLYLAKWIQPELFFDIDPEGVHRELLSTFYNMELDEVYVYP